jgi:hypothetical protein
MDQSGIHEVPAHVRGVSRAEQLLRERADLLRRLDEIDKFFTAVALATETGIEEGAGRKPEGASRIVPAPKPASTPIRVRQVFVDHPDRALRSPEIVDILRPNLSGDDRKHFDMLVRGAISKFCRTDPPIVRKIGHGLYMLNKIADTTE